MDALPEFLTPVPVVDQLAAVMAGGALGGGGSRGAVSGFAMSCQQEQTWCWAAVVQAIEAACGKQFSQSRIASDHVAPGEPLVCATPLGADGGQSCGRCDGSLGGCGDDHSLGQVLSEHQLLKDIGGPPTLAEIVAHFGGRRKPMPVRIEWPGGNGHFVCVSGYRIDPDGTAFVMVHDPLVPGEDGGPALPFERRHDELRSDYSAASGEGGEATHSYEVL